MPDTPTPDPTLRGLELSRHFYFEAVRPILEREYAGLAHAAALLGPGSEVLGYDDPMSTDHHWGPRVMLFLTGSEHKQIGDEIRQVLAQHLPLTFRGYPTNFSEPDPDDSGTQHLVQVPRGPVNHRVEIDTIAGFIFRTTGLDLGRSLTAADWLSVPEQHLLSVTAGAIFHDELSLRDVRGDLAYFPDDVWYYLLACGWERIGQEEHLMGRAGLAGDELGSAIIGARLVRDCMRLWFLMSRTYAPYPKWLGTAFGRLSGAKQLEPILMATLQAANWGLRGELLAQAYRLLARRHNGLGLTRPMPEETVYFHGRPFPVMAIRGFAAAWRDLIADPHVLKLDQRPPIGGIDQVSDNTDLLSNSSWRPLIRCFYE